ncbi:MAG: class I SAM-dependent methyltransferase [Vicingaceae bacterium]
MPPQDINMTVEEVVDEIFSSKEVKDKNGKPYPLESNLDQMEGAFLQKLIKNNAISSSIEVGCAFGLSSLFICSELQHKSGRQHTIIDPYQNSDWHGIGVNNLRKAGIDFFNLIEKPSEIALPELLNGNSTFDFAFIDGWHTFDHTLIDFFYLSRMLKIGGIMVIDDVGMPAVNRVLRYVLNYPCYEFVDSVKIETSSKKKIFNRFIGTPWRFFGKFLPNAARAALLSPLLIQSDRELGIDASMVAIRKISEDNRAWNWYESF